MAMMGHRSWRRAGLALCSIALLAAAVWSGGAAEVEPFRAGDKVCLVGDSITHGGWYHEFVWLFYLTRFPQRELRMINCGVCADTAGRALGRLSWDVLAHAPTVATVMLGMNDFGCGLYGPDKTADRYEKRRRDRIAEHAKSMRKMVGKLKESSVRVILLTPSIFDDSAELKSAKRSGANAGLGVCAENVRVLAAESGTGLVDFFTIMNRINRAQQAKDPKFTIVGPDRVHPRLPGHFVMAYQFLKAQGMPRYVARMVLDAATGRVTAQANCELGAVKVEGGGIAFDCLAQALPFPVHKGARPSLALVPFMAELNREDLVVTGLKAGTYELAIDEQVVGEYRAADLAAGVNLAGNEKTPQYRQALKVMSLNGRRRSIEAGAIRDIAAAEHLFMHRTADDPSDFETNKPFFEKLLAENPKYNIRKRFAMSYLKNKPDEEKNLARVAELTEKMYEANAPVRRRFVLRRK